MSTPRTALITGASSGIGAATARALAAQGHRTVLVARRAERLAALAAELGPGATALPLDVGDPEAVAAAVAEAGAVDLVVANAGVMLPGPVADGPLADWRRMLEANVWGVMGLARATVPALTASAQAGGPADLVVVSSLAARTWFGGYAAYSATKAAASAFGSSLRSELGPAGVRVTVIEPGLTRSELREHVEPGHRAGLDGMFAAIGALDAADVADVIAFATSRPAHVNLATLALLPTTQA